MTSKLKLSYIAGCIDSDGFITIKKSNYGRRIRKDMFNTTYQSIIGLKQVTPQVPNLLKDTFRGCCCIEKTGGNRRDLFRFQISNKSATEMAIKIQPYIMIKQQQINCILELHKTNKPQYKSHTYWFCQEHPNWKNEEMIQVKDAYKLLGYTNISMLKQAMSKGTILSHNGMIPMEFIDRVIPYKSFSKDGKLRTLPNEIIKWRNEIYEQVRELNKNGISGTPVYHREGCFATKV